MALADVVLKAKVNVALARDPRVGVLDIGVRAGDGMVTLTGDVDDQSECDAAAEIARGVPGVREVRNELTCGVGKHADTAEMVTQRLLAKLEEAWSHLPDQTALTQADYLRWALWLVYKFRLPDGTAREERARLETEATEQALTLISGYVSASKALVALEMLRQAEAVADSPHLSAPRTDLPSLVATPLATDANAAA